MRLEEFEPVAERVGGVTAFWKYVIPPRHLVAPDGLAAGGGGRSAHGGPSTDLDGEPLDIKIHRRRYLRAARFRRVERSDLDDGDALGVLHRRLFD